MYVIRPYTRPVYTCSARTRELSFRDARPFFRLLLLLLLLVSLAFSALLVRYIMPTDGGERERDRQQPISSERLRGSPNTPVLSLCSCAPHDDDDGGSGGTPTTTYTRRGVSTSSSSAVATALRLGTSIRRWRLSVVFSVVRSDRKRQRARERGRERRETGDRAIWQQWLQAITDIVAVD